ncbi:MAG: Flp pilus assembly protein CpaB [Bdellovibrionota bacterium]|nr:MAG: Flp pilus assembly protein CpaB [Bdellovibrionota bacterium]
MLIGVSALGLMVLSIVLVFLFVSSDSSTASTNNKPVVVQKEEDIRMVDVLVPVQDIDPGQALEPGMFRRESRPQIAVDSRAIKDFEEITGYYARSLIVKGQPLQKDYITTVRPVNNVTAKIPPGFRAVTISVDARSSVEGWARPGARVDVVWASKLKGQAGVTVIVQNAEVLSAERNTENKAQPGMPVPSTVTLLVSAEDAAKIQLAVTTGSLNLTLRGDNDPGRAVQGKSVTVADLLGGERQQVQDDSYQDRVVIGGAEYILKQGKLIPKDAQ